MNGNTDECSKYRWYRYSKRLIGRPKIKIQGMIAQKLVSSARNTSGAIQ
jgi:hypothetical protein